MIEGSGLDNKNTGRVNSFITRVTTELLKLLEERFIFQQKCNNRVDKTFRGTVYKLY